MEFRLVSEVLPSIRFERFPDRFDFRGGQFLLCLAPEFIPLEAQHGARHRSDQGCGSGLRGIELLHFADEFRGIALDVLVFEFPYEDGAFEQYVALVIDVFLFVDEIGPFRDTALG